MPLDWASHALHCSTWLQLLALAWFAASRSLLQYIFSFQITTCLKVQVKQLIVFYRMLRNMECKKEWVGLQNGCGLYLFWFSV
jgi:hypothetical protein